ncbi:alkaline ceramidase 2 [Ciona intestinalis]
MYLTGKLVEPLSSKIDWCEPNYVVSTNIAEFWNTLSNIPMLIIPLILIYLYKDYSLKVLHCRFVNVVWALLVLTAIGSAYFHATLSLLGLFVDEIGILWMGFAMLGMWLPGVYLPEYFNKNRYHYHVLMIAGAITSTILGLIKPQINHIFLFLFLFPTLKVAKGQLSRHMSPEFQRLCKRGLVTLTFALVSWVCDRFICSFWLQIHFPYLHAIWHVLIAIATYQLGVCCSYSYAVHSSPNTNPTLQFWKLAGSRFIGLWFVSFDQLV